MQEQRLIAADKVCQFGYDLVNDLLQRRVADVVDRALSSPGLILGTAEEFLLRLQRLRRAEAQL